MKPSRLRDVLVVAIGLALPLPAFAQDCGDLKTTAVELAGSMETFRLLPASTPFAGGSLDSPGFLYLAAKCIDGFGSGNPDPTLPPVPDPPLAPIDPYPGIALNDAFYRAPFSRDEYLAFFRQIDVDFDAASRYPEAFDVVGGVGQVRYAEVVYYAAGVLRSAAFFGELPTLWDKYVIAPKGLVPWQTPDGYEEFTSALTNAGAIPFFPNSARRYYARSPHEYALFKLAMDIIGNQPQPYNAGERIYDWVIDQWIQVIGYSAGTVQHGTDQSGWERSHYYFHTSGIPRRIMSALLRAVGIPSASAGAAYFSVQGWVGVENHRPYGSDPLENPFYYDTIPPPTRNMPFPSQTHDFVQGIQRIADSPSTPGAPGEERSLSINARDVLDYGPDFVLDHSGDFDILSVRVKTPKGYFYYTAPGFEARMLGDALTPLVAAAHARGKKVYAAFSTLADSLTATSTVEWKQMLNETIAGNVLYPNIHVSPCINPYKEQLKVALRALIENHAIDGIVLDHHYYSTIYGTGDTVGNPACPTGSDWMAGAITSYAADLIAEIRATDPSVAVVLAGHPLGRENRYFGLAPEEIGYQDLAALSALADRIVLDFQGTYWVTMDPPYFHLAIDEFWTLTGQAPWVSFNAVDEWEYTSEFYTGLLQKVRGYGVSGFNLHTPLSAAGDLAPAFTPSSWYKISVVPEPQGWMTLGAGIAVLWLLYRSNARHRAIAGPCCGPNRPGK